MVSVNLRVGPQKGLTCKILHASSRFCLDVFFFHRQRLLPARCTRRSFAPRSSRRETSHPAVIGRIGRIGTGGAVSTRTSTFSTDGAAYPARYTPASRFFFFAQKREVEPLRNRTMPYGKRTWALGADGGPREHDGGQTH